MKDLLANQRNKTGRLRFISLLFALLLLPLGAWADSYFGINIDASEDGIWVTDQNAANILGDGTMSYDVTNNILTLNGINLSFTSDYFSDAFIAMVDEDHPTLTVRLVGANTLTLGDKACFFNGWGITFTTDTSNPGTLTINTAGNNNTGENWGGALFIDNPTHDPMNATYNNGLGLTQNGNTYTVQTAPTSYGLTVGGVEVTSNNASSITGTNISGTVSFDATENTLTLNGATITGSIVKTTSEAVDQLIINLVGTNTVNGQISFQSEDRMYLGDLSFTGSGSLIIASNDEYGVFDEVSSVNTGEGLYIATDSPDPQCYNGYYINGTTADDNSVKSLTVSTSVTYPIWVYNTSTTHYTQLTAAAPTFTTPSANVDENHSGSVSFSDNTLTLTNFLCKTTEGYDYVFFVGKSLQNLTVNLVGESSIHQNGFHYAKLQETEEEPTLTFTTSNNGKLTYESDPEFWGNVTLNYENGLGYYSYVVSTDWPRLIIGGTYVRGTTNTVEGYSNVSFDDATNTLTLGGVTIGSQGDTVADIEAYVKDLKVEISGDNTVYGRFLAFYEENGNKAGTITFKKKSGAETANLTVSGEGDGGPIYNFVSSTLEEGLYISGVDTDNEPVFSLSYYDGAYHDSNIPDNTLKELLITSNEPDTKLWIGEQPVTSTNAGNVFEGDPDLDGKVSYDMETQTLSLKGVTMGDDIVSNVGTLTIDLTGSNSILSISASGNATALAFTGDGALTLGNSDGVITNFSSVDTGDFNLLSNSTPGIHWNALNKMYMTFDDSEIATELTLTKATVYPLWVGGVQVTSDNASNITGTNIQGGKVSYDAETHMLTLNGTALYTNENDPLPMITCNGDLTIQLIGSNGIYFNGSYSNYAIKNTGNSGTLTITQSGTDVALNITTVKNEGASMGLCDGFTAVNFANGLAYIVRNGSRTISTLDLASPEFNVYENEISFSLSKGLLYGTSNGAVVAAEYFYKITYVDASTEGSGVEHELASDFPSFNLDASQKIAVKDLAGACTIEAYTKLNGATSTANKAKKFGPAESPMRLVYGADPVDLVLAPAIEDGDGIKINGIEANVTYNSTTGKVSSETMGSQGGIVSLSYANETVQTLLLNNYFDMDFDVVPPAPTINLAAGEYLNTHANVTVTSAELANTTIKYQWDNGDATDYPSEGGIPLQTGTLKAWVVYTAGDTPLASDVSEAAFTVLNPAIAMSVYEGQSNEKRLLLQNESGMSMYYAIDYVSTDLNDVPETLYGQAPELLGPCTVTAYAKSVSVQGTTFTGKLFGFTADAVTTSYAAQANAPAIVPDFNGSVTYDYSDWAAYLSVNTQGQITPIKVTQAGNAASVSATFIFSENPSFTVLNAEGPSQAATNYIVDGAFSVTINPLELTVTPDNVTVDAGETIVLTFKYAGFAEGEDKTFLTTEPTASYGNADVTKPGSYTITVSGGEAQNYTFVYETGTLTVKRRLNVSFGENNEWATYCATEDLATPQGLQAYQVTNVSGTTVSTEEVGYIPKNTAVLLKMTNADYVLSASAYTGATSTFDTTNKLEGTTEATSVSEINGNVYVLYNDQFVKATSGTIPALRGYLVVSTTNARALDIVIGDATGFSDVRGQMEDAQETIYNLQGQRVSKAQKGLVIVNGKKVVKK